MKRQVHLCSNPNILPNNFYSKTIIGAATGAGEMGGSVTSAPGEGMKKVSGPRLVDYGCFPGAWI